VVDLQGSGWPKVQNVVQKSAKTDRGALLREFGDGLMQRPALQADAEMKRARK